MPKANPNLSTKDRNGTVNILEKTYEIFKGIKSVCCGKNYKCNPVLAYKRNLALRKIENLENKFSKNQLLSRKYSETIKSYISKGYETKMERTQRSERNKITNYIPHLEVINKHKSDKLKAVFDASPKYKGYSLNDYLLEGPDLLNNLVSTITRFGQLRYAVSGDMEQMIHQISVSLKGSDALRFLWRENSCEVASD